MPRAPAPPTLALIAAAWVSLAGCGRSVRPTSSPAHVDSATVDVNGTHLFYEAAGQGTPVVLIHSGNLDRRMWDANFLALAAEHRVIRYDARGYGRSGRADKPYRGDEDLFALLQALRIPRASIVGLSLGGRIAIDFALAHPEMIDKLVLAGPGLSGWEFRYRDTTWLPEARAARDRRDYGAIAVAWLKQDFMRPAMARPEVAAHLKMIAAENGAFWEDVVRYGGEADRQGAIGGLHHTSQIRAPTLLIVGSLDTKDIHGIVDTLAASITGARRVEFEGAGHLVNVEQPERFNREVLQFLRP